MFLSPSNMYQVAVSEIFTETMHVRMTPNGMDLEQERPW
jgi:hypothetical protein